MNKVVTLLETDGERLHALLWRLTRRNDVAEDLMQDLALKLAGSAGFAGAEAPYAYARRAATNLAMDWHRARKRQRRGPARVSGVPRRTGGSGGPGLEVADPGAGPAEQVEAAERVEGLMEGLARCSERDREVLTLRFLEGCDFEEVGAAIGKTAQQARMVCYRAIKRLRQQMNEWGVGYETL